MARAVKKAQRDGKIARTAQRTIPYREMERDGVCRLDERHYSRTLLLPDINYHLEADEEKALLFDCYCRVINYFGPTVDFQISCIDLRADLEAQRRALTLPDQEDAHNDIRREFSEFLAKQLTQGNNGQEKYLLLTFTVEADSPKKAAARLERVQADVCSIFKTMGVSPQAQDGYARLSLLHRCLHPFDRQKFRFNWDTLVGTGLSSKDYIAPDSFLFKEGRTFRVGPAYGAASFLQLNAAQLPDRLLTDLLELDGNLIFSLHVHAIEQGEAVKLIKRKLTDLDSSKINEQKRASRSGYDYDVLPPDLVTFGEEAQKLLAALQEQDEKMFLTTILLVHTAPTRQELENNVFAAQGVVQQYNCELRRLDYQQEQGFMSALPLGINQVEIQRRLTTSSVGVFVPFNICEAFQPGRDAIYYGLNTISRNMILCNRKKLKCPNGIVLGTPGSGKSFSAKREITNVFLATTDDILVLDVEAEYISLMKRLGAQVVRIALDSTDYLNPMDLELITGEDGESPLSLKCDFILSLCELILAGKEGLQPIEKTVIDRCTRMVYQDYLAHPAPERMPVLGDLYDALRAQEEPEAKRLAAALEMYVKGSLSVLNHRTNVNLRSRLVCYDISGLSSNLKKPGMLTVQNSMWGRTAYNRSIGKSTRLYLDEFHLLLREPQTAAYTAEIYKRFRKFGGIPTSATQNVKDLLASPEIENILENSDFILMLNQAAGDRAILAQRLGISPRQLEYVTNSAEGEGLLFFGDKIIPFVDKFPHDTQLYKVMTTKLDEVTAA